MATSADEDGSSRRKIASGVTSRSRRRRKQKVLVSENQKENVKVQDDSTTLGRAPTSSKEPCKDQDSAKATTKPSKQRSRTTTKTKTTQHIGIKKLEKIGESQTPSNIDS